MGYEHGLWSQTSHITDHGPMVNNWVWLHGASPSNDCFSCHLDPVSSLSEVVLHPKQQQSTPPLRGAQQRKWAERVHFRVKNKTGENAHCRGAVCKLSFLSHLVVLLKGKRRDCHVAKASERVQLGQGRMAEQLASAPFYRTTQTGPERELSDWKH